MRLFILIMFLIPVVVLAQPSVQVVGLFKNKALVIVDGQRKLMRVGESFNDVTLEVANSKEAILSFDGINKSYSLGSGGGFTPSKTQRASYSITPSYGGTYKATGSINGRATDFIVDTGASTVSINSILAKQLGIDYKNGKEVNVLTAADKVTGYMVTLKKVTLGSIRLSDVEATILEGEHPQVALLGMSFLKHLTVVNEEGRMRLIQK